MIRCNNFHETGAKRAKKIVKNLKRAYQFFLTELTKSLMTVCFEKIDTVILYYNIAAHLVFFIKKKLKSLLQQQYPFP